MVSRRLAEGYPLTLSANVLRTFRKLSILTFWERYLLTLPGLSANVLLTLFCWVGTWVWVICNMLSSLVIKARTCDLCHKLETWTVPLLTFMLTKSYPVYGKYIRGLRTNILEQIIHVSASLWFVRQIDKGWGWQVFMGSLLTRC